MFEVPQTPKDPPNPELIKMGATMAIWEEGARENILWHREGGCHNQVEATSVKH